MTIALFFLAHWHLSVFCQTFFLHRYGAHAQFSMSPRWQRFFHLLTYVSQGASFLHPRAYAVLHRMHHAYSDTERDPHSPVYFKNVLKMMWTQDAQPGVQILSVGVAESMVTLVLGFGALTACWLCVAVGMRRRSA